MNYQQITLANIPITVKRIDLVHPTIAGNKFYKLKYNLQFAKEQGYSQILSFGGAYSNHIHALSHACHEFGFDAVGIIRGDELADKPLNPTLTTAKSLGMELRFISRKDYRQKDSPDFLQQLQQQYPNAYIIPEGGSNELAVKGCTEMLSAEDIANFDIFCCAVGTGGTIAGLINSINSFNIIHSNLDEPQKKQVIGFSVLNSNYQRQAIARWTGTELIETTGVESRQANGQAVYYQCQSVNGKSVNEQSVYWQLLKDDYFAGYGKFNEELLAFIKEMQTDYELPLEPIYTGKALFYLKRYLQQKLKGETAFFEPVFSNSTLFNTTLSNSSFDKPRILFIHTGGLQGVGCLNA